jgi:hypothetical protein
MLTSILSMIFFIFIYNLFFYVSVAHRFQVSDKSWIK